MTSRHARHFLTVLLVVALATPSSDVSAAAKPSEPHEGGRQSVSLTLSSESCTIEEAGARSTITTDVGAVVVNSPAALTILDGSLTLRIKNLVGSRSIHGAKRKLVGSWTLAPAGSPSKLRGRLKGRRIGDGAELRLKGRGRDALSGVRVQEITFSLPHLDDACGDGQAFEDGKATVAYRQPTAPRGAVLVPSANNYDTTVNGLRSALEENPNLKIIAEVDHSAGAASRDIDLAPTFEIFFGNPAIGSPLMANSDRTTGIDLPQKMVIWQDLFGDVYVSYNVPSYLQSRHRIASVASPQLNAVAGALANLASAASGTEVPTTFAAGSVRAGKGLVVIDSQRSADEAVSAIQAALVAAPPVNVAFTLDHQANAATVGMDLLPTSLIVFGNPSLGSILMQADQSVALDLPQKLLVFEDSSGGVSIAYNDPAWLAKRHGLRRSGRDVRAVLATLDGALANFAGIGA